MKKSAEFWKKKLTSIRLVDDSRKCTNKYTSLASLDFIY